MHRSSSLDFDKLVVDAKQTPSDNVSLFRHQVAGKLPMYWDQGRICKPAFPKEVNFYANLKNEFPALVPYTPKFWGVVEFDTDEGKENNEEASNSDPDLSKLIKNAEQMKENYRSQYEQYVEKMDKSIDSVIDDPPENDELDSDEDIPMELVKSASENAPERHQHTEKIQYSKWSSICLLRRTKKSKKHNQLYIALEDMTKKFRRPCILDLKMGTRQYVNPQNPEKMKRMFAKCQTTTSHRLGLRVCGMQAYRVGDDQYTFRDKYYGRQLDETAFRKTVADFFQNGSEFRGDLLPCFFKRLQSLLEVVEHQTKYRFYSSSLLLVYEGNARSPEYHESKRPVIQGSETHSSGTSVDGGESGVATMEGRNQSGSEVESKQAPPEMLTHLHENDEESCLCDHMDLRLIDFANVVRQDEGETKRDEGLLFGIKNLSTLLKVLYKKHLESNHN